MNTPGTPGVSEQPTMDDVEAKALRMQFMRDLLALIRADAQGPAAEMGRVVEAGKVAPSAK